MPTEMIDDINRRQRTLIIGGLAVGVIILVGLVAALTLIPAQTLSSTLNQQIAQEQQTSRAIRWDKQPVDLAARKKRDEARVQQAGYVYADE